MADYSLGTAKGKIQIDADTKGVDQAQSKVDNFAGKLKGHDAALNHVATGLMGIGVAAAAGFGGAVLASANFEKGISAIGAVSGATGKDLDAVRAKALQLGKDTKFSAGEAAGAMEELAKAGVSLPDIMNGAADATVALAAAGEIDLPQAATIASNAMNQFGLSAQQLPGVADKLAGAANASAIGVEDLGQSLSQVGAVAKLAGVSFDDTATAIAVLGNAGIKGSDAGTSLKTMFQNLIPSTKEQAQLFDKLGITTNGLNNKFFDAQGNTKSLADVSQVLQDSLKGMSKEQKLATLQTLFGSDAIRAAAILADNGATGFNKMADAIGKTKAADVAAKRMDNLGGSIEQLKGSLETIAISSGSGFQQTIKGIVDALTGLLNKFLDLSPGTQKFIVQLALAAGAMLGVVGVILKLSLAFKKAQEGVAALKVLMTALNASFLTNPVFLVIAAIIALGVALFLAYKHFKGFHDAVDSVWQVLKGGLIAAFQAASDAVRLFVGSFTGKGADVSNLSGGWMNAIINLGAAARQVFDFLVKAWHTVVAAFSSGDASGPLTSFQRVFSTLGAVVRQVFAYITSTISNFVQIFQGVVNLVSGIIHGNWSQAWKGLTQIVGGVFKQVVNSVGLGVRLVWTVLGDGIKGAIDFAVNFFMALPGRILSFLLLVVTTVLTWIGQMVVAFVSLGVQIIGAILGFLPQLPLLILQTLAFIIGFVIGWVLQMQLKFIELGVQVLAAIVQFFSQLPGRIADFLKAAFDFAVNFATNMIKTAIDMGTRVLQAVVQFFSQLPGNVANFMGAAVSALVSAAGRAISEAVRLGSSVLSSIVGFIQQVPGKVAEFIGSIPGAISGLIGAAAGAAAGLASGIFSAISSGIDGLPGLVSGIFDRIVGALKDLAGRAADAAKSVASSLWNGFKSGLGIKSPSYIEKAMTRISENMDQNLGSMTKGVRRMQGLQKTLPRLDAFTLPPSAAAAVSGGFWGGTVGTGKAAQAGMMGGGGGPLVGKLEQNITGILPDEVETQTARALRRAATQWELR